MNNKDTLARLLAEEDLFVVHKQMETAYFDPKKRELGLPIFKEKELTDRAYDLLVCHEVGHAIFTSVDFLDKVKVRKINHSFANIIEDVRIEKKIKLRYAGSVAVFKKGYEELDQRDFFGIENKDINSYNLIDRINLFSKLNLKISFTEEEQVWVDKVYKCETSDEVLDLAEQMFDYQKEHPESNQTPEIIPKQTFNPFGENRSENSFTDEASEEENIDNDEKSNSSNNKKEASEEQTNSISDNEIGSNNFGGTEFNTNEPQSLTDKSFNESIDQMRDKKREEMSYVRIPKFDLDKIIISYKEIMKELECHYNEERITDNSKKYYNIVEDLEKIKKDNKKTVAYMVKEFEMKRSATQYAKINISKTGVLNMKKLYTYKYSDDLFKKAIHLPDATNHGMVLMLDWSGSMTPNMYDTMLQLFNLIWFCRRTNIPFRVYAFSDDYYHSHLNYDYSRYYGNPHIARGTTFQPGCFTVRQFNLLNFFSSSMSLAEENQMMHYLLMLVPSKHESFHGRPQYVYVQHPKYALSGTPLNETIMASLDIMPKFKKETGAEKVNIIFLTDGESSTSLYHQDDYILDKTTGEYVKGVSYINDNVTVIDPVSGKQENYRPRMNTNITTTALMNLLRHRVYGIHIIGFYLLEGSLNKTRGFRRLQYLLPQNMRFTYNREVNNRMTELKEMKKKLMKDRVLVTKQMGFDEYYILPGGDMLQPSSEGLDDKLIGATKNKLATAFSLSQSNKISSRQLLNKFVAMVS
tara:strand:+ start:5168 stop:7420 length:2253 start_codon:yes stop_codon:yes gene_type:complete